MRTVFQTEKCFLARAIPTKQGQNVTLKINQTNQNITLSIL